MSEHNHHGHTDFEELYASGVQWSGNPNDALLAIAKDLTPGTAVDIGCGEGADAVWLAEQGWNVVAIDPSPTAIERSKQAAAARGVAERIEFLVGDISAIEGRTFDFVSCFYVPYAPDAADVAGALEKLVALGGVLGFVHHLFEGDAKVLSPRIVAQQLTELTVESLEESERNVSEGAGAHHRVDIVLVARRA